MAEDTSVYGWQLFIGRQITPFPTRMFEGYSYGWAVNGDRRKFRNLDFGLSHGNILNPNSKTSEGA